MEKETIYSYHSKHDKIFVSMIPGSVYIWFGWKGRMMYMAISRTQEELQQDIDYVLTHCNSKSAKRWFKKKVDNGELHL